MNLEKKGQQDRQTEIIMNNSETETCNASHNVFGHTLNG